jgi:CheY-like chemotaxis protein
MDLPADLKILLAEDNPINQRVAVLTFNQLRLKCDIASNGKEAFEKYQVIPYDLIFMDLQMPVMNGLDAARQIRLFEKDSEALHRAVIIALTGNEATENKVLCTDAGMDDFMEKPIRIECLKENISRFLQNPGS